MGSPILVTIFYSESCLIGLVMVDGVIIIKFFTLLYSELAHFVKNKIKTTKYRE